MKQLQSEPIVRIQDGSLRGSTKIDWKGKLFYSFQGIPYGKPPIGQLRFKAPKPAEPWTGVRDATKRGNESYSRNLFRRIVGSEDCLFLNVYTSELSTSQTTLKPVMVWIHGGSFTSGSGNYESCGPDYLVSEDVVVVTINYRLGLLGFASFENPSLEIPGNAGLKDQVLALKWVQKNIANFCGNPNNVTIFGGSAGGASVHYLMLSPMAKGLFHRAIIQSGVATSMWARGQRTAPLVSKALGINTTSEVEIVEVLKNMSVEEIFALQEKIPDPFAVHKLRPFAPVIETFSNGPVFLSEDPVTLIKSGKFNQVPMMIGYNSREGMLLLFEFEAWNANFELMIPYELNVQQGSEVSKLAAETIRQFYYGNEIPSSENMQLFYILQTDGVFFISINRVVQYHTAYSSMPIYYYKMSADTRLNAVKSFMGITDAGTAHSDELGYLFKTALTPEIRPQSSEYIALQRIIKLWTTFARYGDPNPIEKDALIAVTWPRTDSERLYFLDIGENLTVGANPEAERVKLWNEIYTLSSTKSKL